MKPVTWTSEKISRFWNSFENRPELHDLHFSKQRGRSLLAFVKKTSKIEEPVLDLGCGSGHLIEYLLSAKYKTFGADVTSSAGDIVQNRFGLNPYFLGFRLLETGKEWPFEQKSISTIFILETVEHLLPDDLHRLLLYVRCTLRDNGYVVITTPNNENLSKFSVCCKKCGSHFHRFQHLRSWTRQSLHELMQSAGFKNVICSPTLLFPDMKVWLRAQKIRRTEPMHCPECNEFIKIEPAGTSERIISLYQELFHLVCIAQK